MANAPKHHPLGLEILAIEDLIREPLEIPEWDRTIWIRRMSGTERGFVETMVTSQNGAHRKHLTAHIAVICCVDDAGEQLFDVGQLKAVNDKAAAPLARILEKAMQVNYMSESDVASLEANLDDALSEDSGSS